MCYSCFTDHWQGRDPRAALQATRPDRAALLQHMMNAITAVVPDAVTDGWVGGPLHAAIDDDNYDCEAYGFGMDSDSLDEYTRWKKATGATDPWGVPLEWAAACVLWRELDEDERSLIVAWVSSYPLDPVPAQGETL